MSKRENFLRQFRNTTNQEWTDISAAQFLQIWEHYDEDRNGYIEGEELDAFLKEFVSSVCSSDVGTEVVSESMLAELKQDFMDAYDDNDDGKIEIKELAQLLPTDENFLFLFQLENLSCLSSSVDFMKAWRQYDKDNSGEIDSAELKCFLRDVIGRTSKGPPPSEAKLDEYTDAIIRIFDENKDGKLQLSEMARLLPVKENALSSALSKDFLRGATEISYKEIEEIFAAYDSDGSGTLEGGEIDGFIRDLLEVMKPSYSLDDIARFQEMLMQSCDLDGDGKICKEELTMMLLGLQKFKK